MTDVAFWFDPGCPWTWITSRWMDAAAEAKGIEVDWRPFSLATKNKDADVPEQYRAGMEAGHRAVRVVTAARAKDPAGVGALYTALGKRFHDGSGSVPGDDDLRQALRQAGLDEGLAESADDASLDATIEASMTEALELVDTDDVGVPIIRLDGNGFFGPIFPAVPSPEDGARLFDALVVAAAVPGFAELKRGRSEMVLP